MYRRLAILLAVALLFVCATPAWAQRTTGTFAGIVVDNSGGVLPGASVVLTNEGTGIVEEQVTSAVGEFVFNYVPPGSYTLAISIPSFKTQTVTGISLGAAQNLRRRFQLDVGDVTENITVSGESPLINTSSTEQRITLEAAELASLPVANRNLTNLLNIGVGLTRQEVAVEGGGTGGSGQGTVRLRLNGLGGEGMSITANGTEARANAGTRSISAYTGVSKIDLVSIESIGEVNIVKGVLPAEFGNALAGNLNVITKAGTNAWHGSLFDRYEGAGLVAKPFFLRTKPESKWNQGGGSLGGPVLHDQAFFFMAFEGYRLDRSRELNSQVPTPRMRNLLLTSMPFPETRLLLDQYPLPTEPLSSSTALLGTFIGPGGVDSSDDHLDTRGDVRIKGGNLSATFTAGHPALSQDTGLPGLPTVFGGTVRRVTASYALARSRWSSETRFGYNYNYLSRTNPGNYLLDPVNPGPLEPVLGKNRRQIPFIAFPGLQGLSGEAHIRGHQPSYSFEQQLTRVTDRHAFKFGGIYATPRGGRNNVEQGTFSYQTEAELVANRPSSISFRTAYISALWYSTNWGLFVQDDWRVNAKLVINAGVRYDYFGRMRIKSTGDDPTVVAGFINLDGQPDPTFAFGPPRSPDHIYEDDKGINVGPRIGLAYNPDGNGTTVISGGWGLMFQNVEPQILESMQIGTITGIRAITAFSAAEASARGLRYPIYNEDMRAFLMATTTPGPLTSVGPLFDPQIQGPHAQTYTVGIQHALSRGTVVNVAYLGTRGSNFRRLRTYNEVDRLTGLRPNPNLNQSSYLDDSQETRYNSLQTSMRQRVRRDLQFNLNYTWSATRSNYDGDNSSVSVNDEAQINQDFFDNESLWGPAIGDVRHNFVGDVIYQTPGLDSSSPLRRYLLGGWQIAAIFRARTGEPITVVQSGRTAARPDVLDAANAVNTDCCDLEAGKLQYLNPAAFQLVPLSPVSRNPVRAGNATTGQFFGPGLKNMDVSVGKLFSVGGGRRVEFRADILNAFNWINYIGMSKSLSNSDFGRITGVGSARVAQLQARFSF